MISELSSYRCLISVYVLKQIEIKEQTETITLSFKDLFNFFSVAVVKFSQFKKQRNDGQLQIPCGCPEEVQYVAALQNGIITGSN